MAYVFPKYFTKIFNRQHSTKRLTVNMKIINQNRTLYSRRTPFWHQNSNLWVSLFSVQGHQHVLS